LLRRRDRGYSPDRSLTLQPRDIPDSRDASPTDILEGARRIERLVERMRALDVPLRIVIIGYLDVERGPWQQ